MLLKYAAMSFRKYLFQNMLTIFQLTAALAMTILMLSSLSIRLSRFLPFCSELSCSGMLAVFGSFAYNGELTGEYKAINNSKDFSDLLGVKARVLGIHFCDAEVMGNENGFNIKSADSELLKRYRPRLEEGKWFEGEGIAAVVSAKSGYHTGDRIILSYFTADGEEKSLEAAVSGVIKENERLAGFSGENDGQQQNTFELFYSAIESYDKDRLILLDEGTLPDDMIRAYTGCVLINYEKGADEQQITSLLSSSGCVYSAELSDVKAQSRKYIFILIYELLPLIVIMLIMALTGSVSTSALSARRQMRDLRIFILCGMQKRQCIMVSFFESLISLAASCVLTLSALIAASHFYPERFYIKADIFSAIGICVTGAIFISVSLTVPSLMLKSRTL